MSSQIESDRWDRTFRDDLAADVAFEQRLFFRELWILAIIGVLVLLRWMFL